jgi:hypothetical protein
MSNSMASFPLSSYFLYYILADFKMDSKSKKAKDERELSRQKKMNGRCEK